MCNILYLYTETIRKQRIDDDIIAMLLQSIYSFSCQLLDHSFSEVGLAVYMPIELFKAKTWF